MTTIALLLNKTVQIYIKSRQTPAWTTARRDLQAAKEEYNSRSSMTQRVLTIFRTRGWIEFKTWASSPTKDLPIKVRKADKMNLKKVLIKTLQDSRAPTLTTPPKIFQQIWYTSMIKLDTKTWIFRFQGLPRRSMCRQLSRDLMIWVVLRRLTPWQTSTNSNPNNKAFVRHPAWSS